MATFHYIHHATAVDAHKISERTLCTALLNTLRDNHIQKVHLGWYIVGYTVVNLILRRRASGAVKRYLRPYIRRFTSPNENVEFGYPLFNAFCILVSNWSVPSRIKRQVNSAKCEVTNDAKLFLTVYRRIYCRKLLTLSIQMSRYKSKCIRILFCCSSLE